VDAYLKAQRLVPASSVVRLKFVIENDARMCLGIGAGWVLGAGDSDPDN
jgi:hypothetical protein